MNFWRKWNFKVSEEPDQVVMFVWKRKWSPAVSAISNALRETISDLQHRFALAVLHTFCPPNWGWPCNTGWSQEPPREWLQLLCNKCALETVFSLEMGTKCKSWALDSNPFRFECSHIWPKEITRLLFRLHKGSWEVCQSKAFLLSLFSCSGTWPLWTLPQSGDRGLPEEISTSQVLSEREEVFFTQHPLNSLNSFQRNIKSLKITYIYVRTIHVRTISQGLRNCLKWRSHRLLETRLFWGMPPSAWYFYSPLQHWQRLGTALKGMLLWHRIYILCNRNCHSY